MLGKKRETLIVAASCLCAVLAAPAEAEAKQDLKTSSTYGLGYASPYYGGYWQDTRRYTRTCEGYQDMEDTERFLIEGACRILLEYDILHKFPILECSCFSAKKPETETGIRELDYNLENGQFHYKQISANDVILRVGEPPKDAFGKEYYMLTQVLKCDIVGTREMDSVPRRKNSVEGGRGDGEQPVEDSPFLRVVSTLVSIKEIGAVQYYDTVEVSSVNYLENEATVKIKELKYIAYKDGRYFTVKYGELNLSKEIIQLVDIKKEKLHPRQRGLGEEAVNTGFKKKWNLNEEFSFGLTVSSSGKTLFIDAPRKTKHFVIKEIYGDVKDIAFKLSALGDVYRHFISSEGYDLRIGSHYEASVETAPGEPKLVNVVNTLAPGPSR
ncbi:hypothetical protein LSTR_LSTR013842 [Laodelphax striatellus]|uniref:Vitellogenin domain-containing protein n=1 Tax=Laodelphax striatellus TaxID=195883 RepID=A0A482XLE4_LAOST|nr:hypothetical protein LSTR_LSTR013842 [Laodelphax striatellus]